MPEMPQPLSPEEVKEQIDEWKKKFKLPPAARGFFKGTNINKLVDLTNSDTIRELDILSSSGELNDDEMTEYYTTLPEFQNTIREVDKVIDDMFNFIKIRIPKAVQQVFSRPGGYHLGPITEIFNTIIEFVKPFIINEGRFFIFHNLPATRVDVRLTLKLVIEVLKAFQNIDIPLYLKEAAKDKFIDTINERFRNAYGVNCPGTAFLLDNTIIQTGLKKYSKSYGDLREAMTKEKDAEKIKREVDEKFQLIQEQEPVIKSTSISRKFGGARIQIKSLYDALDALVAYN